MTLMLDICAGLGGASAPFVAAGWRVVRIDSDPAFAPEVLCDVRVWSYAGPCPVFVWASPPCTEFSRESMPWSVTGKSPDLSIVLACIRIIRESRPAAWALENVRGSIRHIDPLPGPDGLPMAAHRLTMAGPVCVWSSLAPIGWPPPVAFWKEKLSSKQRALRAKIPAAIGESFIRELHGNLFTAELIRC